MADAEPTFAAGLIEGLGELAAWKRGEMPLEVVNIEPMPPERLRAIRRRVATSARAFEARFGIPAATLNNWEQGRRVPDPAARLLFKILEIAPEIVEKAAKAR